MQRKPLAVPLLAGLLTLAAAPMPSSFADSPPIEVGGGYHGTVGIFIYVPGSPGTSGPITQPVGGGHADGTPAVTCSYAPFAEPDPPLHDPSQFGQYDTRTCTDGTVQVVWVPNPGAPAGAAPPGVPAVTPAQLAREARDLLVLPHPTVHRSPRETNDYQGAPFTWVHLHTWFWTGPADYRSLSHTLSVGAVSATVTARPVSLLFDPGDGSDAVRCDGPGTVWSDGSGNGASPSGCDFVYQHATDGAFTARMGIVWDVTWTGTGGAGGQLEPMETLTDMRLQVLQVQVVNK